MSEDHTHQQPRAPRPLCVPVRENACGSTLRLFRDRDGSRCAAAFTTPERLAAVLGADHLWVPLAEDALRDLVLPLDVHDIVVDPALVAPPVGGPTTATTGAPTTASAAVPTTTPVSASVAPSARPVGPGLRSAPRPYRATGQPRPVHAGAAPGVPALPKA